jgi:hypothetical protein
MKALCVASGAILQVSRLIQREAVDAFIIVVLSGNNVLRIFQSDIDNANKDWLMLLELKLPQEDDNIISLVSIIAVKPFLIACVTVANTLMILGTSILKH